MPHPSRFASGATIFVLGGALFLAGSSARASTTVLVGGADSCVTPDAIFGAGAFSFDDTFATTGPQGQAEAACNVSFGGGTAVLQDVWFRWTAPTTGVATFATCGTTAVDTKIAAYAGSSCPTAPALACNDDNCGFTFQSSLTFACTAGTSYVLQIGLYPGTFPVAAPGAGQFTLSVSAPPVNDGCATPTTIAAGAFQPFDTTLATTSAQGQSESACSFSGSSAVTRDLWFAWTAPSSGPFAVVTHGLTRVDTKVAVYAGAGCPAAPAIGCNDDARADAQSVATFTASAGSTYAIQLGCRPGANGGTGELAVISALPNGNDDCATPRTWIGAGTFVFDDTFATTGAEGQAFGACSFFTSSAIASDVWYAWTADASGTATLSTCAGTSVDTKIAVYAGAGCPTGPPLVCQDDTPAGCGSTSFQTSVSFAVTCGATYTVQLGTYPLYSPPAVGGLGRVEISVAGTPCTPPPTALCFGDGSGAACPCGNFGDAGRGCASSVVASGARLVANGTASVANDTLVLVASDVPNGPGLHFQGTVSSGGGLGIPFGDGLRCVGGSVVRLGIVAASGGTSSYPTGTTPPNGVPISVKGAVSVGSVRYHQYWYRDSAAFCTSAVFNLTPAVAVTWAP